MLGVILTGHGSFATGLYEAAIQIIGQQPQFTAINFPDGTSTEALEQQLREALQQCDQGDGAVFLTDILGGSPFRTAALLSFEHTNVEVVTGTNLQLVIEMLLERDDLDAISFRDMAIESAKRGVTSLWHENQNKALTTEANDDGI